MSRPRAPSDSPAGQDALRKREKAFDEDLTAGLRALAVDRRGRLVLRWLLGEVTGTMAPTFAQDPHTHAYRAGRREVGLVLLERVEAIEPGTYAMIAAESAADELAATTAATNAAKHAANNEE